LTPRTSRPLAIVLAASTLLFSGCAVERLPLAPDLPSRSVQVAGESQEHAWSVSSGMLGREVLSEGEGSTPPRYFEIEVPADFVLRITWSTIAPADTDFVRFRWTLLPDGSPPPADGTPSLVSAWGPFDGGRHLVSVGPFPSGATKVLYMEAEDGLGQRALITVRIHWVPFHPMRSRATPAGAHGLAPT
jgi:hypothetical protein